MAANATAHSPRRPAPSGGPVPPSNSIARGATARSAVNPRVTSPLNGAGHLRRSSTLKATPTMTAAPDRETKESLSESLKRETELKEHLLVQLQNKEQSIANLSSETDHLVSALAAAETRINELYADQSRMEDEMTTRIEVAEKLRTQVRELERDKRDLQRRYNEQTATFDAERQALYDNEQHLKSRIQSLMQARSQPEHPTSDYVPQEDAEPDDRASLRPPPSPAQEVADPEVEPAEMTSLRLELSTLSTSYASLQSTVVLLQTQLLDLKRVNQELQEENESFTILLRERTLSGHFYPMKQTGEIASDDDDEDEDVESNVESQRSTSKPTLDRVEEAPEEGLEDLDLPHHRTEPPQPPPPSSHHSSRTHRRNSRSTSHSPNAAHGESLADLPVAGPGLDLAAELGRAENKDILDNGPMDDHDTSALVKGKRGKKLTTDRKVPQSTEMSGDIDALRSEVKSLKDANKALSLYASRIIDRIIAQEGFEHVLAADYDKQPQPPRPPPPTKPSPPETAPPKRPRPQSTLSFPFTSEPRSQPADPTSSTSLPNSPDAGVKRRSLSFDWKSFSMFGSTEKKDPPNLRPLTLKPGASAVVSARKLDTHEDEEDKRERERLHATMQLMGIQPRPPQSVQSTPVASTFSPLSPPTPSITSPFSFFRKKGASNSETSSLHSTHNNPEPANLTQEALEHAEAQNKLAALDAHEHALSFEMSKGASGGFTEISPRGGEGRRSRRSRRSGGGSGSTVFSAGLGGADEEAEE